MLLTWAKTNSNGSEIVNTQSNHNQGKTKNATANVTYNLWKAEIPTQKDLFLTFSRGTNLRISSTSTSTPATPNKLPLVLCKNKS